MQESNPRLAGRVAIITGASRGLGMLCALAYAQDGAKVVVVGRNVRESGLHLPGNIHLTAQAIGDLYGVESLPIACDVTDPSALDNMIRQVLNHWGQIDILLNNAAYVMPEGETIGEIPHRLFEQMLRVNVLGAFYAMRAVLPAMRTQRNGSIINVSGRSRAAQGSPLDATKMAIETLTIGLAAEVQSQNIAVNCLRPVGFIDTPGVLLNPGIKPSDLTPPDSYAEAAVLMAAQAANHYSGQLKTDAEVIRDLADEATLQYYGAINPAAWRESLNGGDRHT